MEVAEKRLVQEMQLNRPLLPVPSKSDILSARGPRNAVSLQQAYAAIREREFSRYRSLDDVVTLFLTNRECPFRCLMCDLWKNTLEHSVPSGAIIEQMTRGLDELGMADHVKLYNSGNFFDHRAIPESDRAAVPRHLAGCRNLIVENHPRFCDDKCLRFRDSLDCDLEIAIGLETIHPEVLRRLNKQMTVEDFAEATRFLVSHGIAVRAFLLLRPPWLTESEGVDWAIRSMRFAFDCGVDCCAVIPTRAGNGIMDQLQRSGDFSPPSLDSLETVLRKGLEMDAGRVLADLWDLEAFSACSQCFSERHQRLDLMNRLQELPTDSISDCSGCRAGGTDGDS